MSDSEINCTPPEIRDAANAAVKNLLPDKSKHRYELTYTKFITWCKSNKVHNYTENCLLAYFQTFQSKKSLWPTYSMLRSCLLIKNNIDISKYNKLIAFLKKATQNLQPKKSKTLQNCEITKFIHEAPDDSFLLMKVLLLITTIHWCSADCSDYGSQGCRFVPAPPGQAPTCARPGQTYCEFPANYPGGLITKLIQEWRIDYKSLLTDENRDEFRSYYVPAAKPVYGPPPNTVNNLYAGAEPIHIPKPPQPTYQQQPGNRYIPPSLTDSFHNYTDGFFGRRPHFHQELPNNQLYNYHVTYRPPEQGDPNLQHSTVYNVPGQGSFTFHDWRKRHAKRDLSRKLRYMAQIRRRRASVMSATLANGTVIDLERNKRQSDITGEELCRARFHFFMPKAAQNNKGNWMYIVNMPEMNKDMTQLVRSEICISQKCSGVCSLPAGYTSRCEQKYVQKRLVALRGSGDELYNDIFWFPSCCTCTLSTTNPQFVN